MALWGLMEPMAPENYWTGMVESSSIPGSQEPESCYTHSFFKGQNKTAWDKLLPGRGSWSPGVSLSLSWHHKVNLSWRHKASLHIPSQVLPQRDWPAPCPHTSSFPVTTVGKFIPLLWDTWTCYLAMSSLCIISITPPPAPFLYFSLLVSVSSAYRYQLNECWMKNERQKTILLYQ